MRMHVKNIQVFETMCKPYLTAKILVVDNNNIINGLQLKGGDPINFSFDGGERDYNSQQYILTISGEESTQNSRTQVYTISTASISYFKDKGSLVQRADMNVPATTVAASIHNEYVKGPKSLHVDVQSSGVVSKTEGGGYVTNNKKPFKAIIDVLERNPFGGFPSGCPMYFEAYDGHHMGPLEYYFKSASAQAHFDQQSTWGREYEHIWTTTHAIISARTVKNETKAAGRSGAGQMAAAASGALSMFDNALGNTAISQMAGAVGGGGKFGGKGGGIQNVLQTDSRRLPLSADQGINAKIQNLFAAKVRDGVNYLVKVPIQGGIYVTVGKGVDCKLQAPIGDKNSGRNLVGGLMLVADVMHDCWFDDRQIQATTTMRCVTV
jgi:hypothetical protein